jgi:quercetin dioxygenase-like cupin family protein
MMRILSVIGLTMALSVATTGSAQAQDPAPPPNRITSLGRFTETVSGQPLALPTDYIAVQAVVVDIPAGGGVPEHFHPEPRYVYVLEGRLRLDNLDTGTSTVFETGAFVVEPLGQWHAGFALDDRPARLLVIDQTEGRSSNMVTRSPD